jgi:hypothetical protein
VRSWRTLTTRFFRGENAIKSEKRTTGGMNTFVLLPTLTRGQSSRELRCTNGEGRLEYKDRMKPRIRSRRPPATMSARDRYHEPCKAALIKDGWIVTDDPLYLKYGAKDMFADLGAEEILGAELGGRKIAVEIKSFLGPSDLTDLEKALGQFILYRSVLEINEPDRRLYLAVPEVAFVDLFEQPVGKLVMSKTNLLLIVFDPHESEITRWIP